MPLISKIGRRAPSVRLLVGLIYAVLTLGGITMVYPLLLMVSGSIKGGFDSQDIDAVPEYVRKEDAFFRRYLESRYNVALGYVNAAWGATFLEWTEIPKPAPVAPRRLEDFDEFRRTQEFPMRWTMLGHLGVPASNYRAFKRELIRESGGSLTRLGRIYGRPFRNWMEAGPRQYPLTRVMESSEKLFTSTDAFKLTRPPREWILGDMEATWKSALISSYENSLKKYCQRTGRAFASWDDVHLAAKPPPAAQKVERGEWEAFARRAPFSFLRVDPAATPRYHAFLRRIYNGKLESLNRNHLAAYRSFDEVSVSSLQKFAGTAFTDYSRFIREEVPLEMLSLDGPDFRYREFLRARFHGDLAACRAAYGVSWKSFDEASMPTAAMDWRDFQAQKSHLRWEFIVRNYSYVLDFLVRHGQGFRNTFILCALFLVTHLTVNPLAAYALSRFGLPSTYKILLFCMATVAFPGEVMMIPSFLQLKELGLLNTFAALVLPGLASGYGIFLLKGFFDSLPKELYESATIDGAGEWTIFWQISMSLSKPILAVMALGAFTSAYGAFFFALIICPDEKMWTLMVWLYQLQTNNPSQSINYAALCLSSIPTLLIFIFCQRIILRGIVVPVEK
jgi:multiple sugar transport system permease protein